MKDLVKDELYSCADEFEYEEFIILYPNPSKDSIQISLTIDFINHIMKVLNIQRQILKSQADHRQETSLDVSELPDGFYLLLIESEDRHIIPKFVKSVGQYK